MRESQSKPVEEEKLMGVLAAGLKAPTHNNLREWESILVKDLEQRKRIVEMGAHAEDYSKKEVEKPTRSILEVPDDYEVATLIPIGYPEEYYLRQKPISLQDKVHYNTW